MDEFNVDITTRSVRALPVVMSTEGQPTGLAVAPVVGGGTFAAGTYFWVITGTDALGETTASNEVTAVIALNGSANLTWNPLPAGTTGVNVYRGTASGNENALITSLGNVTQFTDTGAAGSAKSPPTQNTATITDQVIVSGECQLCGWSLLELTGTARSMIELQDNGNPLGEVSIAANADETQYFGPVGVEVRAQINLHVVKGSIKGVLYVSYDN